MAPPSWSASMRRSIRYPAGRRGRAGGAHRRAPASADAWPGRGTGAAEAGRRETRNPRHAPPRRMKTLRRVAIGLAAIVALLFVFGRPITWGQAALIMWDV